MGENKEELVLMVLGVQLFLILESTLKRSDLVLKPLRRENSR